MSPIKLILPNDRVSIPPDAVVFFLEGPIRGGDWQRRAIMLLTQIDLSNQPVYVVCPCHYAVYDTIRVYSALGITTQEREARTNYSIPEFPSQTHWKRYYLDIASRQGCVIFWLPEEDAQEPHPEETGPYGQDAYGVLGEWRGRGIYDRVRVTVGAEPKFPGLPTIKKNFREVFGDGSVIHDTLEKTLAAAIAIAYPPASPHN